MAKKIIQFRYFGDGNSKNTVTQEQLTAENIFSSYSSISKLGIQAGPGTIFKLGSTVNDYPIEIGLTGIYELDLEDYGYINYIQFEEIKMPHVEKNGEGLPLLIDIVYEGGI